MEITQKRAEEITGLELPRSVSERESIFRKKLPYGVCVLSDGSEVLYNRDYEQIDPWGNPILDENGKPLGVGSGSNYWFYKDGSVPSENIEVLARISEVMKRKRDNPQVTARDLAM
ncbi:MAG: hypothetical protein FWF60_02750 [Oscillospiraceae bacterium]|nr:hypothetical protein [Oscillospiraceae bacterium]